MKNEFRETSQRVIANVVKQSHTTDISIPYVGFTTIDIFYILLYFSYIVIAKNEAISHYDISIRASLRRLTRCDRVGSETKHSSNLGKPLRLSG